MSVMKISKLREIKSRDELLTKLTELKTELSALRVAKVTSGQPAKLAKIKGIRKSIARVLTIVSSKERQELRKYYRPHKYKPLDLRPKLTRAKRRELPKKDKYRKTLREKKKSWSFPKRKYALKLKK